MYRTRVFHVFSVVLLFLTSSHINKNCLALESEANGQNTTFKGVLIRL
jgi:hypothetical protein